jgi:hypothetical protein
MKKQNQLRIYLVIIFTLFSLDTFAEKISLEKSINEVVVIRTSGDNEALGKVGKQKTSTAEIKDHTGPESHSKDFGLNDPTNPELNGTMDGLPVNQNKQPSTPADTNHN